MSVISGPVNCNLCRPSISNPAMGTGLEISSPRDLIMSEAKPWT
jgi:hypothetical protein